MDNVLQLKSGWAIAHPGLTQALLPYATGQLKPEQVKQREWGPVQPQNKRGLLRSFYFSLLLSLQAWRLITDGELGLCLTKYVLSDLNMWCNTRYGWEFMEHRKAATGRTERKRHFLVPELVHLQAGQPTASVPLFTGASSREFPTHPSLTD